MAHESGMKVSVSLVPINDKPERQPHGIPLAKMPGDPTNRWLLAFDADDRKVDRAFQDNPGTLWVITPTRILEKKAFYAAYCPPVRA